MQSARAEFVSRSVPRQGPYGRLAIENMLCPVDFSDFSLRAFTYATCIARYLRSRLFVQHTVRIPYAVQMGIADPMVYPALEASRERAAADLRRFAAVARLQLPELHMLVSEGDAHDRLFQCLRENKIELIVMGARGISGGNGHTQLGSGSLTQRVVREAACPVLIVCRPQKDFVQPNELQPMHLDTILFATDFSRHSDRALAQALDWASRWSARLLLVHAAEEPSSDMAETTQTGTTSNHRSIDRRFSEQLARAWETLHQTAPTADTRIDLECRVRRGSAEETILRVAEDTAADLIVMGSRAARTTKDAPGATISGVLRDGRFPVLAVPGSWHS